MTNSTAAVARPSDAAFTAHTSHVGGVARKGCALCVKFGAQRKVSYAEFSAAYAPVVTEPKPEHVGLTAWAFRPNHSRMVRVTIVGIHTGDASTPTPAFRVESEAKGDAWWTRSVADYPN